MISYINILIFILGGTLVSLLSNKLLLRFSQSLGIRNKNDVTVRWSNQSKPSLGGIGLFLGFLYLGVGGGVSGDQVGVQRGGFAPVR